MPRYTKPKKYKRYVMFTNDCKKCGSKEIYTTYQTIMKNSGEEEYLANDCKKCGFVWTCPCLDNSDSIRLKKEAENHKKTLHDAMKKPFPIKK